MSAAMISPRLSTISVTSSELYVSSTSILRIATQGGGSGEKESVCVRNGTRFRSLAVPLPNTRQTPHLQQLPTGEEWVTRALCAGHERVVRWLGNARLKERERKSMRPTGIS